MVSSQVPYTLQAFWGVSIRELHLFLWQSWSVVKNHVQEGTLLRGHYQHRGISTSRVPLNQLVPSEVLQSACPTPIAKWHSSCHQKCCSRLVPLLLPNSTACAIRSAAVGLSHSYCQVAQLVPSEVLQSACPTPIAKWHISCHQKCCSRLVTLLLPSGTARAIKSAAVGFKEPHGDKLLTVFLPQQALDLGTPPRLCYPLVIFLVRTDQGSTHPDETVALINVIHIKDLVCTLPTSILAQYLKQANGQLSCLKQLYLATGISYEDESNTAAVPQLSQEEQLCVVCQYFPLSRALLPCRHTCICASCFIKVDRCPMCRSPIRSYFCVRGEEYMPGEPAGTSNKKPTPLMQWLLDWNDHLTDFLGFQR
uniref:RING-type domain-containing protein n=1 Tax=Timema douglasi TaxID=61478 RepID=A0A7R8ZCW2_TIMDO|nr:unnamed protein product [Timema douglasi]